MDIPCHSDFFHDETRTTTTSICRPGSFRLSSLSSLRYYSALSDQQPGFLSSSWTDMGSQSPSLPESQGRVRGLPSTPRPSLTSFRWLLSDAPKPTGSWYFFGIEVATHIPPFRPWFRSYGGVLETSSGTGLRRALESSTHDGRMKRTGRGDWTFDPQTDVFNRCEAYHAEVKSLRRRCSCVSGRKLRSHQSSGWVILPRTNIDPDCLAPWKSVFLYQPVVFRVHVRPC